MVVEDSGRVLGHLHHVSDNALKRFGDLPVVGTEGNALRVETKGGNENSLLLPVLLLHFFIQKSHRL